MFNFSAWTTFHLRNSGVKLGASRVSGSRTYSKRKINRNDAVPSFKYRHNVQEYHVNPEIVITNQESVSNKDEGGLDYEVLVANVEGSIMADQHKAHMYNSRDLLVKSNPSLFENIPDVTNPREIYNFLSKSHARSIGDLTAIRDGANENAISFPRLSRTTSMKDLRRAAGIVTDSRRQKHFSGNDISKIHQKDPSVTALFINAPYLSIKDLRHLPKKDTTKAVKRIIELPQLKKERTYDSLASHKKAKVEPPAVDPKNDDLSLPMINTERMDTLVKETMREDTKRSGDNPSAENNNLDKWFSEMPGDVVDQANKAVMEESMKEKAQDEEEKDDRQKSMSSCIPLPLLKPISTMPREYSELLVRDSHKDYKPSVINREHYKLRQKSLLKLKTNAVEENSKAEKSKSAPPTQYEPPSYSYSAEKLYPIEKKPSLRDLAKSKRAKSGGLKTVDIEEYALEAYEINPSDKFTFAKQQNDENCPPLPNILKRSRTSIDISTRYNVQNTVKVSSGDDEVKFSNGPGKLQRALTIIKVDKPTLDEFKERYRNRNKSDSNIDPTARDTSSAETRSGSRRDGKDGRPPTRVSNGSLPKEQKSVLKLKTLEVFGDNGESISGDQSMAQKLQLNDKPYVKLDLRQSGHQGSLSRDDCFNQPSFLLSRNSKGDSLPSLTFQFNTGEVIVTRNQSVLDQDQYTKVKRNYYPKREPLKSTAHLSPVLVSRNRSVSPLKESRETHTQKSFYDWGSETTNTLTPDFRNIAEFTHVPLPRSRGPRTPKANTEIWSNGTDCHVWPQKPEKIDETEEENDSPVGKVKKDSPALSSPNKDSSPDKEELQAKRDTSTSMTSFVERNKLNDNAVNTVNKKGIQDSTSSSENRPQVSKTNHGET